MREDWDENGVDAVLRTARKSANMKMTSIDPELGVTLAVAAQIRSRKKRLTKDANGMNSYERAERTGKTFKRFYASSLFYQGSYEKKFLEEQLQLLGSLDLVLQRFSRGQYMVYKDPFEPTKERTFRPDFIDKQNRIIYEIKSTFVMIKEGGPKMLKAKLETAEANGFQVVLILDKKQVDWKSIL